MGMGSVVSKWYYYTVNSSRADGLMSVRPTILYHRGRFDEVIFWRNGGILHRGLGSSFSVTRPTHDAALVE